MLAQEALALKGENVRVLAVAEFLYITDFFVLVTTGSTRQTRALADGLNAVAKEAGFGKGRVEGTTKSTWVLMDFDEVIVHLLTADARHFYALDQLWADAEELPLEGEAPPSSGHAQAS